MAEHGTTAWGRAWLRIAEPTTAKGIDTRLPRARSLARQDAVHNLAAVPGQVTGTVVARDREHRVDLHVPTWATEQREHVLRWIADNAATTAALLRGDAPDELADWLVAAGIDVAPTTAQVDAGCPCRERRRPCTHALAVCYVLVQHIDEEPALALTLRGLTRPEPDRRWIPLTELNPRGFFEARTAFGRGGVILGEARSARKRQQ
ncbi:hypothetical protein GCM10012275_22470 [Longimycelium tulufanense]|uniref:SWIM-type domain-containing protein n=1 Tax=Longimycelium tulufanense TaxID=907463 RepID=A0A8J3FU03_9PSEU|nr:hypothetical protein [Longimycelium tulufanense]GGM51075.1 hypothetical protein GCM10012275_22470 [Longimycelium tulufanense]